MTNNMRKEFKIDFIGFAVSLVVGCLFWYLSGSVGIQEPYSIMIGAISLFLSFIISEVIINRYRFIDELKKLEEALRSKEIIEAVINNPYKNTICEMAKSIQKFEQGTIEWQICKELLELLHSVSKGLADKKSVTIGRKWVKPVTSSLFALSKEGDEIFATSYVTKGEWWDAESLQMNLEAAERGVKIRRIFIFEDEKELSEPYTNEIIKKQMEKGIELKGLPQNGITGNVRDIIIFNFKKGKRLIASQMFLSSDRKILAAMLYLGEEAKEIKDVWERYNANRLAKPINEYLREKES